MKIIDHLADKKAEQQAYRNARNRCTNPNHEHWRNYGGRGIEFRFTSFNHFLEHVGHRPTPSHSLDRINNEGHYEPGNIRWATPEQQYTNKRKRYTKR